MLTDEARAALAAMPEGCIEALHALVMDGPKVIRMPLIWWRSDGPTGRMSDNGRCFARGDYTSIPADPTAIVAEVERVTAATPYCVAIEYDAGRWWLSLRDTTPERRQEVWHADGEDMLPLALRLFHAAYDRAHGGGDG